MDNLGGKVYTTKAGILKDLLVWEQPDLGIQSLAFEYKQYQIFTMIIIQAGGCQGLPEPSCDGSCYTCHNADVWFQ